MYNINQYRRAWIIYLLFVSNTCKANLVYVILVLVVFVPTNVC